MPASFLAFENNTCNGTLKIYVVHEVIVTNQHSRLKAMVASFLADSRTVMLHGPCEHEKRAFIEALGFERCNIHRCIDGTAVTNKWAVVDIRDAESLQACLRKDIRLMTTPRMDVALKSGIAHLELFPRPPFAAQSMSLADFLILQSQAYYTGALPGPLFEAQMQAGGISDSLMCRFLCILAEYVDAALNLPDVAMRCGISLRLSARILKALENSYVIYFARQQKRSSHHLLFWDAALLAFLYGITSSEQLHAHPQKNSLIRNFTVTELYKRARQERPFCTVRIRHQEDYPLFSFDGGNVWYCIDCSARNPDTDCHTCINIDTLLNECAAEHWSRLLAAPSRVPLHYVDSDSGPNAPTVTILNGTVRILSDTHGAPHGHTLTVQMFAEGEGPPLHTHAADETFYVLEGIVEVHVLIDRQIHIFQLLPGDSFFVPSMTVHTFKATGTPKNVLIASLSPAGPAESFFLSAGAKQSGRLRLPDHPDTTPEAIQALLQSMEKHHFKLWKQSS